MNFEGAEIHNSCANTAKSTIRGVIVLTDNRNTQTTDKSVNTDPKCSAQKEIEFDPFQFTTGLPQDWHQDDKIAELTRRVTMLEEKIVALSKSEVAVRPPIDQRSRRSASKKKNRRKFKQLVRDNMCPHCQKMYGSDTALKYHLKLKHQSIDNHSQVQ